MNKLTRYLILILASVYSIAQTVDAPIVAGNTAVLVWDANDSVDNVTGYAVYRITPAGPIKVISTTLTQVSLSNMVLANGTYGFYVTASNVNGESPPSTNLYVRYFANKASSPKGLLIK